MSAENCASVYIVYTMTVIVKMSLIYEWAWEIDLTGL